MSNNRLLVALLVSMAVLAPLCAQKSAYGRFGYGELSVTAVSAGRAMGGIGYGVRDNKMLNPMNPASYSAADTLSFLFDVGAYINTAWYKDGENKATTFDGNIDFAGLKFRIIRGLGLSFGLMPFSSVHYSFGSKSNEGGISQTSTYTGEGGFSRVYLGLGYNLFNNFSIGANTAYFFGNTAYEVNNTFSGGTVYGNDRFRKLKISTILADFGAQYTLPLSGNRDIILGLIYSPKMKLNSKFLYQEKVGGVAIKDTTVTNMDFDYPQTFGGGLTFSERNKYMIGADVQYQQWSKARFFGNGEEWEETGAQFRDKLRLALGGQYIPNAAGRNYFRKIRYRIGASYSNSYFRMDDGNGGLSGAKEYGVSAGFGFPMMDNRSAINVSFDYTTVRPERKNLIEEQYFKITISYTMNEIWFRKIKLE